MANSESLDHQSCSSDVWSQLKQAIAASSGFKRWRLEQTKDSKHQNSSLDALVQSYLRETLETLAY